MSAVARAERPDDVRRSIRRRGVWRVCACAAVLTHRDGCLCAPQCLEEVRDALGTRYIHPETINEAFDEFDKDGS